MRITYSEEISENLTQLARRKHLKYARPLALFVTPSNTATAEELVKVVCGKYPGAPDLVRGVAKQSDTTFFFDKSEATVLQELKALETPTKGKTAPKVIVKMIYTRLVKIQHGIDNMQRIMDGDQHGYYKNWVIPTLTRESLVPGMGFDPNSCEWDLLQMSRDFGALLHREDFTEELIDEAWKLFQTHKIMEE